MNMEDFEMEQAAVPRFDAAYQLKQSRKPAEALRELYAGIAIYDQNVWSHVVAGRLHRELGEFDKSIEEYLRALQLFRSQDDVMSSLLKEEMPEWEIAQELGDVYWLQALKTRDKRHWASALNAFVHSIDLNSNNPAAMNGLGIAQQALGMRQESEMTYRRAIALDERYAPAYKSLYHIQLRQGKFRDALRTLRLATRLGIEQPRR